MQLNHVAIHVADVERSRRFYQDVVGLQPLPRPAFDFPGAWFRVGVDQELHLIGGRALAPISHRRGTHSAMRVASIEEAKALLDQHDVPYEGPKHRPDGALQIFFTDPDGHVMEFCELPGGETTDEHG